MAMLVITRGYLRSGHELTQRSTASPFPVVPRALRPWKIQQRGTDKAATPQNRYNVRPPSYKLAYKPQ